MQVKAEVSDPYNFFIMGKIHKGENLFLDGANSFL